ncbi:MAG: hypothetical protein JO306_11710 [Gemmatimonadetes bacterium]|nr:hypothetical protein [Gemmatimonadota bacterium]
MKAYVVITGAVFGLLTLAHVARVFFERTDLVENAVFVLITLASAALCGWSIWLLRRTAA